VAGPIILMGGLLTFVFSTILGWSYYGEKAVEYLFGKIGVRPYRCLWVIAVFLGSVSTVPLVWDLADAMNALMAIPNLVSLFLLNGVIVAETRRYLWENRLDDYAPEAIMELERLDGALPAERDPLTEPVRKQWDDAP